MKKLDLLSFFAHPVVGIFFEVFSQFDGFLSLTSIFCCVSALVNSLTSLLLTVNGVIGGKINFMHRILIVHTVHTKGNLSISIDTCPKAGAMAVSGSNPKTCIIILRFRRNNAYSSLHSHGKVK